LQINEAYAAKGVQCVAVYPNRQETAEEIARDARERGYSFPVVRDANDALADRLGASMTPEAVLVDAGSTIRYRGRIDDNRDQQEVTRRDLALALDAVLAGKPVAVAQAKAFGCVISRPAARSASASEITYCRQVSRILQKQCQDCHRP